MAKTLISTQTADDVSSIDFTSGIDGTYKQYVFSIVNFKPTTDAKHLCFQVDTGTNTGYNQTITSSAFDSGQVQSGSWASLDYDTGQDQAQGTALQKISYSGESNTYPAMSGSGELTLYDPSNGTFVTHFMASTNIQYTGNNTDAQTYSIAVHTAGYINTTTALTRVRFAALAGNIFTGTFTLYGVS